MFIGDLHHCPHAMPARRPSAAGLDTAD
jgi:hypothetical protein